MYAKKSLGQNFLMHAQTGERIVEAAKLPENATVLEIGPGTGMLTRALLKKAAKVIAIEADNELIPQLEETFAGEIKEGRLVLIQQDVRSFDPTSLAKPYVLVANIPYYITGEIIRQFLTASHKPTSMTLLVQKEVAVRIARSEKESLLSLSVKAYGTPKYAFTVPCGAFIPAPNVDSAVLSIQNISGDLFESSAEEVRFFAVLKAGFAHKRKLLARNLEILAPLEKIYLAFEEVGLMPKARAEDLSLAAWSALAKKI
ncbi:MAG: hypothetical protein JWN64_557 [Parcubacteria group bacterium]|nr:hypothetical protein [Parcubacteria group bacterium]